MLSVQGLGYNALFRGILVVESKRERRALSHFVTVKAFDTVPPEVLT